MPPDVLDRAARPASARSGPIPSSIGAFAEKDLKLPVLDPR
jgi:hypothetical protein